MENKIIFARMKDVVVNSLETIILPIKVVIQTLIVDTPEDNPEYIELMLLTELVESYEDEHYPIEKPPLDKVVESHLALA